MSLFDHIPSAPMDPILGLEAAFKKDPRSGKINLTAGIYKDEHLITPILSSVKKAEEMLIKQEKSKEYLPIDGDKTFLSHVGRWLFSDELWQKIGPNAVCFQTIGGTGALRLGAELLKAFVSHVVSIPSPSWPNHHGIFLQCQHIVLDYPYYDKERNTLDFDGMMQFLSSVEERSVVLLHACCHNPSGKDLTLTQWREVAGLCKKRSLLPFIDAAYIGFAEDVDKDCFAIRLMAEMGLSALVAVSFSKNFSLYGERVGALFVITHDSAVAERLTSQMKILVRRNYSSPQRHGAAIVSTILETPALYSLWYKELQQMQGRIRAMRESFSSLIIEKIPSRDYHYLQATRGMFCFCGLSKDEVERLINEFGIYMTYDGRINVAGLQLSTIEYVVDSMKKVLE